MRACSGNSYWSRHSFQAFMGLTWPVNHTGYCFTHVTEFKKWLYPDRFFWDTRFLARTASRCRQAYILRCVFSFFFFRRLMSEVTERISTKLGHIFTYDCYLKNLVRTNPGIYPHGLGAKTGFLGPTLNFDRRCYLTIHKYTVPRTNWLHRMFYLFVTNIGRCLAGNKQGPDLQKNVLGKILSLL